MSFHLQSYVNEKGLVPVQFNTDVTPYRMGDIAGFDIAQANDMINRGLANLYDTGKRGVVSVPSVGEPLLPPPDPAAVVAIPDEWEKMNALEMIALAKEITGVPEVTTKAAAKLMIETELERRNGNGQDEVGDASGTA